MAFTFGKLVVLVPDKADQLQNNNQNINSNSILDKLAPQFEESEKKAKRDHEIRKVEMSKAEKAKAINTYYAVPSATKKNKKLAKNRKIVTGESFVVKNSKYIEELMNSQKR